MCGSRHRRSASWAVALSEAPSTTVAALDSARPATVAVLDSANRTIRASTQERETVIGLLGEHTGAGRLSLGEFEERVSAAYAAQTLTDLDRLLNDLPAVPSRTRAAAGRGAGGWVRRYGWRSERWGAWLGTAVICVAIWAFTSVAAGTLHSFWPFWVIVPWGLVIVFGGRHRSSAAAAPPVRAVR